MIEKVQRANGYGFTLRLGLWLLGMVMVLLAPTTGKASSFDGQYHGTFSGDGSGSITFSVTGGVVSGSVSGSWDGASISGKFSGTVSADGRMATELSGTIHTAPRSWLETVGLDAKFEPGPFSGSITGTLAAGGISSDPSDPVSTSASGTWYASAVTDASGGWRASGTPISTGDTGDPAGAPGPGTPEKPVESETTEYTWADYARDFEKYTPEEQVQVIAKMTPEERAELDRSRVALKKKQKEETPEYTWDDYAKDFEETYTPEEQAKVIAGMTPEQRAELDRSRTALKKGKTRETDEDAWVDYAKDFEELSPEKQAEERKKLTPAQEAELDRVRGKLEKEQKTEATEYGWADYAKDFAKLSTEKQGEERAKLTPAQAETLDRFVKETQTDGEASDESMPFGTPEVTQKPEEKPKKEAPPVSEMTRQEYLLQTWDNYQKEYHFIENYVYVRSTSENQRELERLKQELQRIKKTYEKEYGHPIPGRDYTETQYPPQSHRQQEALSIYQDFRNVSEAYNKAAAQEAFILKRLREIPALNTEEEGERRKAYTKQKEALEKQLEQIQQEWADEDFHADYGPLKTETIPDPQHNPLHPDRQREVDAMEYQIKGGGHFENGRAEKGP